jgi:hypothetical protein
MQRPAAQAQQPSFPRLDTLPLIGIAGRTYPMSVIGILGGWVALNVFVCAALLLRRHNRPAERRRNAPLSKRW